MDAHQNTAGTLTTGREPATSGVRHGPGAHRIAVVALAVVAAVAAWAIIALAGGVPLEVRSGASVQHIGVAAVVIASLTAGLLAWVVASVIGRRWPDRARGRWTGTGAVALLVSFAGPLGGLTPGAVVGLLVLHLVVGSILVLGLRATLPSRPGLR